MTDEQDWPTDLLDYALEILAVAAGQAAQRVRRSDDRDVFAEKFVVQTTKAGCVGERTVDENDRWISPCELPFESGTGRLLPRWRTLGREMHDGQHGLRLDLPFEQRFPL
jgi:hypothetical protein